MPVLYSDLITNQIANPPVRNNVNRDGARVRRKVAQYETGGTQSNSDIILFFRVRSSDVIHSLLLSNDALTGATDVNFGLMDLEGNQINGANNQFDDAQTLAVALTRQEKRVKTAAGADSALGVETLGQTVWQNAGLTEDPVADYYVAATLIAAGSASGTIVLEMDYTAGD